MKNDNNPVKNIDKIHTTKLGIERVRRNLGLQTDDVVLWCKEAIEQADIIIHQGKNWYVCGGGMVITVNAQNLCVITAHPINAKVRIMRESENECLPEFLYWTQANEKILG
jgi:hypothetical protein